MPTLKLLVNILDKTFSRKIAYGAVDITFKLQIFIKPGLTQLQSFYNIFNYFLRRDLMQGNKFANPIKAEGKVIIVTGSNTGIGKETALELARRKATVYMACRDLSKCDEARKSIILETKNRNVYCRELDLASLESIKNFVKRFKAEQVNK